MMVRKTLSAEVRLELRRDLLLQRHARVEHHPQQADDLQAGVQVGVDPLDGVDQIGEPFEREKYSHLHRDDHAVRAAQAVDRQQAERRRAVDQDEVVVGLERRQRLRQAPLAVVEVGPGRLQPPPARDGRQQVVAAGLRARDRRAAWRCQQDLVDGAASCRLSTPLPMVALPCGSRSISSTRATARRAGRRGSPRWWSCPRPFCVGDAEDPRHGVSLEKPHRRTRRGGCHWRREGDGAGNGGQRMRSAR